MNYIEVNSDRDLVDIEWHEKQLSKYEKQRLKDINSCTHPKWAKKCTCCNRIISSETTDEEQIEYHKLQSDYKRLEMIIIKYIYG